MIGRRAFLALGARAGALGLVWLGLAAHTPYRQWRVYRQRYLLIVASKTDRDGYRLCEAVVAALAAHLPDSKPRPSRAPSAARVASLLATGQMDVAVLTRTEAVALRAGGAPFADYGPVDLAALFDLGDHLLVCRADFPQDHGFLVVQALYRSRAALPLADAGLPRADAGAIPAHPGVLEFLETEGRAG